MTNADSDLLNWRSEATEIRKFLDSAHNVLHVSGSKVSHLSGFSGVIEREAAAASSKVAYVDPENSLTATPLAALCHILSQFALNDLLDGALGARRSPFSALTNIHAGRDVDISNVTLVSQQGSEGEELQSVVIALREAIAAGQRFDGCVVVFVDCHQMKNWQRRLLAKNLWQPALAPMGIAGMKAIFLYCGEMKSANVDLPPPAHRLVSLPSMFDYCDPGLVGEIASLALKYELESSEQDAYTLARTVLKSSDSVVRVYDQLTQIRLRSV